MPSEESDRSDATLVGEDARAREAPSFQSNMSRERFEGMVARIVEYIHAGDAFQVVPSQRWSAQVPVEAFSIYRGLRVVNPSPYMYFLDFGDFEIAGASPRVAALVMGTSDLTKDLRARDTPDRMPLWMSLQLVLLAARAHGLALLDGVFFDLDDMAGFERECRQGRALGFDGKTLIHPKTISAANAVFSPSAAELERARRVIAAHDVAASKGQGVALLDGRLVERLHVEAARRVLDLASAITALEQGLGARV